MTDFTKPPHLIHYIISALWATLLVCLLTILLSCTPKPPIPPEPPPGPEPTGEITCAHICERLWKMKCPSAEPTREGASCLEVCANVDTSGLLKWNKTCMMTAPTCKSVDECQ